MSDYKYSELLTEDIRSKVRRLKNLTRQEKDTLIKYFKQHPQLEGDIDWNDRNLTFDDFREVLDYRSYNRVKKAVKKEGIRGLREGKDYIDISEYFDEYYAYIPLNHNASRIFGTEYIGSCTANWCSSSNRPASWNDYASKGVVIIIFVDKDTGEKFAGAIHDYAPEPEMFDAKGDEIRDLPKERVKRTLLRHKRELLRYNSKLQIAKLRNKGWINKANISSTAVYTVNKDNTVTWERGTWIDGTWEDGVWKNGNWKKGLWKNGTWEQGLWEDGTWEYGTWEGDEEDSIWWGGIWKFGYHKGGTWEDGEWRNGIWWDGVWENGVWHKGAWVDGQWLGGEWLGGFDQYKNWHPEGDSPDKW